MSKLSNNSPQICALREYIFKNRPNNKINDIFARTTKSGFIVFLSICNTKRRSIVVQCKGKTLKSAWEKAEKKAIIMASINAYEIVWAKADIVNSSIKIPTENLKSEVTNSDDKYFFRRGIAFDEEYNVAFLEEEINCGNLLSYKTAQLSLDNINKYREIYRGESALTCIPDEIILFSTAGVFCDEKNNVYDLYSNGLDRGRRVIDIVDDKIADTVIKNASLYLLNMIQSDGKFIYGYKPISNKEIRDYNILRHTGSIWSLITYYRITENEEVALKVNSAIDYLINDAIIYRDDDTAYVVEHKTNEVKIGGNGLAVIMLTEYMDVFKTNKYIKLVGLLANGILALQDKRSGKYYHVLNYPDFSDKDEFRTIYYDGEATFALIKAYSFIREQKYLDSAVRAVENFILKDYTKYRDHWVAYSLNEITKYIPDPLYYEFAMQNVKNNFKIIYHRPTIGPTFMELLMAGWQTYERWRENETGDSYLSDFEVRRFAETIYKRAFHMLNGYFYPEFAMYLKRPGEIVNTFFTREDSLRIRIDDIQHCIGGYYYYSLYYNSIRPHLSEEFLSSLMENVRANA